MYIDTDLPISTLFFKHWAPDGQEVGIIVAKAAFRREGVRLRTQPEAPELTMADVFEGDPATTPLAAEQDLAPGKPATDFFVRAVARSPTGRPLPDWAVSLEIADRLNHGFHVRGPCQWVRNKRGRWQVTPPGEIEELPISYSFAYGGMLPETDRLPARGFDANPAGRGFADAESLRRGDPFAAAQIGELAEFMAADPLAEMSLRGFGPIAKAWLPRRSLAGTFDESWQRTRHPRMPLDYDLAFWNAAARGLQIAPHLVGHEPLRIDGLGPEPVVLKLPGAGIVAQGRGEARFEQTMTLDTVTVDVSDANPHNHTATMVWRLIVPEPQAYVEARLEPIRTQ